MSGASPPTVAMQTATGNTVALGVLDPPPEGYKGVLAPFPFAVGQTTAANYFQLNSQSGLLMSQVETICVDNTQNPQPLNIVHGAFNEQTTIPAYTYTILPTFSAANGIYSLTMSTVAAAAAFTVNVTLLNYVRQAGSVTNTNQSPTPVTPIYLTNGFEEAATSGSYSYVLQGAILTPDNPTYIYGMTLGIISGTAAAAGLAVAGMAVSWSGNPAALLYASAVATGAGAVAFNQHTFYDFSHNPLIVPPNSNITMNVEGFTNLDNFAWWFDYQFNSADIQGL